jgi:hypothetical protein
MNAVLEPSSRTGLKKHLHRLPVGCVGWLKALAIMKNESWIVIGGVWDGNIRPSSTVVCNIDGLTEGSSGAIDHGSHEKAKCSRTFKLMLKTVLMSEDFPTPVWMAVELEHGMKTKDANPSDDEDSKPIKITRLRSRSDK